MKYYVAIVTVSLPGFITSCFSKLLEKDQITRHVGKYLDCIQECLSHYWLKAI